MPQFQSRTGQTVQRAERRLQHAAWPAPAIKWHIVLPLGIASWTFLGLVVWGLVEPSLFERLLGWRG